MTIQKITRKRMTENGLVTEYLKTSIDQVVEESTGKSLDVKLQEIEANIGRDFTTEPINLASEVTGNLPKTNYELPNASEIIFSDSNFVATNTEDAIKELFQFADSGKQFGATIGFPKENSYNEMISEYATIFDSIIQELENQGIDTTNIDYLTQIPDKIEEVASKIIPTSINKTSKLNVTAPYSLEVPLNNSFKTQQLVSSLIEYVGGGSNVLHYNLNFDNTDEDDFIVNPDLAFDGTLSISNSITVDMDKDDAWDSNGDLYRYEVTKDNFKRVGKLSVLPEDKEGKSLIYHNNLGLKYTKKREALISPMTGYTSSQGYCFSKSQYSTLGGLTWYAFDGIKNNDVLIYSTPDTLNLANGEYIGFHFNTSVKVVNEIEITIRADDAYAISDAPRDFIIQSSNDMNSWGNLATFNDVTWDINNKTKSFIFNNTNSYNAYRIYVIRTVSRGYLALSEIQFYHNESLWEESLRIESDGMTNMSLLNRQITTLPSIPMTIKSGILSENDTGKLYSAEIDLKKYNEIGKINSRGKNSLYKNGKYLYSEDTNTEHIFDMKSSTTPAPYVVTASSAVSGFEAWKAFSSDLTPYQHWNSSGAMPQWIQIDCGQPMKLNVLYMAVSYSGDSTKPYSPRDFYVSASKDGQNFEKLGIYSNIEQWSHNEKKSFNFDNDNAYRYYRVTITYMPLGQLAIHWIHFGYKSSNIIQSYFMKNDSNYSDINLNKSYEKYSYLTKVETTINRKPLVVSSQSKMAFSVNGVFYTSTDGLTLTQIQESAIEMVGFTSLELNQAMYDLVGELPTIRVFNPNDEEVTINTTVEPFTIYDEFGDSVEVLSYDATGTANPPSLSVTANWSPIDELDGNFEVVTLSEDSTPRQLYIEGSRADNYTTLAISEGDINLTDVDSIEDLTITAIGNGKVSPSIDGGVTWLSYIDGEWTTVADASQGLTFIELNNLTEDDLSTLKGDSDKVRFSYFITKDTEIDHIEMRVRMVGDEQLANTSDFEWEHDTVNNKLIYHIKKSGTYSVNTLD